MSFWRTKALIARVLASARFTSASSPPTFFAQRSASM